MPTLTLTPGTAASEASPAAEGRELLPLVRRLHRRCYLKKVNLPFPPQRENTRLPHSAYILLCDVHSQNSSQEPFCRAIKCAMSSCYSTKMKHAALDRKSVV